MLSTHALGFSESRVPNPPVTDIIFPIKPPFGWLALPYKFKYHLLVDFIPPSPHDILITQWSSMITEVKSLFLMFKPPFFHHHSCFHARKPNIFSYLSPHPILFAMFHHGRPPGLRLLPDLCSFNTLLSCSPWCRGLGPLARLQDFGTWERGRVKRANSVEKWRLNRQRWISWNFKIYNGTIKRGKLWNIENPQHSTTKRF